MSPLNLCPSTLYWYPGLLDIMVVPIVHSLCSSREVTMWNGNLSDATLGNVTNTVLTNMEGWNGLFTFRVTSVNQFGSSESSEVQVTLGMSIKGYGQRSKFTVAK